MPRIHHRLPLAIAVLTFVLFEAVYYQPRFVFLIGALQPVIFFAAIYLTLGRHLKTPLSRFQFLITPTLLTVTALAFSLLLEGALTRHLLALVVALFSVLFFESMFTYVWHHETYESYSLENLSSYALTLAIFLGTASLLGLFVLLGVTLGLIATCALVLFVAVNYEFFWMSKIPARRMPLILGVLTLLLLELFLAFLLLPFHFMVAGAALTVLWYTAVSLTRASVLGLLTHKMTGRHLILSGGLLLLLFLATRWI